MVTEPCRLLNPTKTKSSAKDNIDELLHGQAMLLVYFSRYGSYPVDAEEKHTEEAV